MARFLISQESQGSSLRWNVVTSVNKILYSQFNKAYFYHILFASWIIHNLHLLSMLVSLPFHYKLSSYKTPCNVYFVLRITNHLLFIGQTTKKCASREFKRNYAQIKYTLLDGEQIKYSCKQVREVSILLNKFLHIRR